MQRPQRQAGCPSRDPSMCHEHGCSCLQPRPLPCCMALPWQGTLVWAKDVTKLNSYWPAEALDPFTCKITPAQVQGSAAVQQCTLPVLALWPSWLSAQILPSSHCCLAALARLQHCQPATARCPCHQQAGHQMGRRLRQRAHGRWGRRQQCGVPVLVPPVLVAVVVLLVAVVVAVMWH